jgi:hypothetical protein
MKRLDTILLGVVALIWSTLALMYATIPAIQMPSSFRVWGTGAVVFLVLTIMSALADRKR